ncbi:MAG TPA: hypothetical protein VH478_20940 [Trebonia sp.]|nr:hypothetical protein [Trebonia sp.]
MAARPHLHPAGGGAELAPLLIREAARVFPARLADLDAWVPPWRAAALAPAVAPPARAAGGQGLALLAAYPATCDAVASLLGCADPWAPAEAAAPGAALASAYPEAARALEALPAGT